MPENHIRKQTRLNFRASAKVFHPWFQSCCVASWEVSGMQIVFYPSQFCLSSPSLLFAVYRLSVQVERLPDFTLLYSFLLTSRSLAHVHVFQNSVVSCKMWSIVKNLKQKTRGESKVVQVKQDYDKDYVNKYFLLHEILLFPLKGISALLFQCFSVQIKHEKSLREAPIMG